MRRTSRSRYLRKRQAEEKVAAVLAPTGLVTECHQDMARAYGTVAHIIETDTPLDKAGG